MSCDLSLCLINRDDQKNLVELVTAARPYVGEIVIVDTGSVDDSVMAARRAGADFIRLMPELVHEDGVIRSFGEARQRSYELATCSWQLWLDTDCDFVDWTRIPETIAKATAFRAQDERRRGTNFRVMIDYSWTADRSRCLQSFTREVITHRDDNWTWRRPIHEYLRRVEGPEHDITLDYLRIVHKSQGGRGCVNDRNLKILQRWEREGGAEEDPIALFYYLGDEMLVRERWDEAFDYFNKVPRQKERAYWTERASFRAARTLMCAQRYDQAIDYLNASLEEDPSPANHYWELARAYAIVGRGSDARQALIDSHGKKPIMGEDPALKQLMLEHLGMPAVHGYLGTSDAAT